MMSILKIILGIILLVVLLPGTEPHQQNDTDTTIIEIIEQPDEDIYDEQGNLKEEYVDSLLKEELLTETEEEERIPPTPVIAADPIGGKGNIDEKLEEKYADDLAFKLKKKQKKLKLKDDPFWDVLDLPFKYLRELINFMKDTLVGNVIAVFLIGVIVFFIVYLVRKNKAQLLKKSDNELPPEDMSDEELIRKADLSDLLTLAESSSDFKAAFRYRYLILIKTMTQYGIIKWDPSLTNKAIRRQIESPDIRKGFKELTVAYDYIWYGEYSIDRNEYDRLKSILEYSMQRITVGVPQ